MQARDIFSLRIVLPALAFAGLVLAGIFSATAVTHLRDGLRLEREGAVFEATVLRADVRVTRRRTEYVAQFRPPPEAGIGGVQRIKVRRAFVFAVEPGTTMALRVAPGDPPLIELDQGRALAQARSFALAAVLALLGAAVFAVLSRRR